jgi:hypothetical protein
MIVSSPGAGIYKNTEITVQAGLSAVWILKLYPKCRNMNSRLVKRFREAAEKQLLCELTDSEGRIRVVAPLGEFYTQKDVLCFATYQYSGYSSHDLPAFRSLAIKDFKKIKVLDIHFHTHKDFNPGNHQTYHKWVWHLPKPVAVVVESRQ